MAPATAARDRNESEKQRGRHHQLRSARNGTAPARVRRGENRGRPHRRADLPRRNPFHDAGRDRAQTFGRRPDDLQRPRADVHSRRVRRARLGRHGDDNRHLYRKRLFQSGLGPQDGQAPRAEHRFLVPLRARDRSRHDALRADARGLAGQGAGRGRDFVSGHGSLSRPYRAVPVRRIARPGSQTDRQGDSRRDDPPDRRRARRADRKRARRHTERRRTALPGGRAARGRPGRGYSAHIRLQ